MDLLTREVLNQTIAEAIDATRNKICAEDEIFQQDEKDLDELTKRVMDLDLPEHDRMIINDYIACLQTVDCRYADISYMAGIEVLLPPSFVQNQPATIVRQWPDILSTGKLPADSVFSFIVH